MPNADPADAGHRLGLLLDEIGIDRAHFVAARGIEPLTALAARRPDVIASLTIVSPIGLSESFVADLGSRVSAYFGEAPYPQKESAERLLGGLPEGRVAALPDRHPGFVWSDVAADLKDWLAAAILDFIPTVGAEIGPVASDLEHSAGVVAGINYQVGGTGPPLVFLPLGLAPSQWTPLVPTLREHYTVFELGGRYLGAVSALFDRAQNPRYRAALDRMFQKLEPSGARILEVGVGPGPVAFAMADHTERQSQITGVDVNGYLIDEARRIATAEELNQIVEFREADALALPFPDDAFDVVYSATMLEELDADIALSEMARVCRPGGKVGAIVRSNDLPWHWQLDLPAELRALIDVPVEAPFSEGGCADSSLYTRLERAGLVDVEALPTWGTERPPGGFPINVARSRLTAKAASLFEQSLEAGTGDGTAFVSVPFHCGVGIKPPAAS